MIPLRTCACRCRRAHRVRRVEGEENMPRKVAEHGEQTVRTWRGEAAEEIEELAIAVEPKAEPVEVRSEDKPAATAAVPAPAKKPVAKKAPARKVTAKKPMPPVK